MGYGSANCKWSKFDWRPYSVNGNNVQRESCDVHVSRNHQPRHVPALSILYNLWCNNVLKSVLWVNGIVYFMCAAFALLTSISSFIIGHEVDITIVSILCCCCCCCSLTRCCCSKLCDSTCLVLVLWHVFKKSLFSSNTGPIALKFSVVEDKIFLQKAITFIYFKISCGLREIRFLCSKKWSE